MRQTSDAPSPGRSHAGRERLAEPKPAVLRPDLPLSVALGGGGLRGIAHIGVLEGVLARGFRIRELVGTSVGALITAYYAAVGLSIDELAHAGDRLRSTHLLWWAALRRTPPWVQRLADRSTGIIPQYLDRLERASFGRLHHGVERIGLLALDELQREVVLCHSDEPIVTLDDATRGAAAAPGLFPSRRCRAGDRDLWLSDAGLVNNVPADLLLQPPFSPRQVLAVDVSRTPEERTRTEAKVERLRRSNPDVPIAVAYPRTFGQRTFLSIGRVADRLVAAGRTAAREVLEADRDKA